MTGFIAVLPGCETALSGESTQVLALDLGGFFYGRIKMTKKIIYFTAGAIATQAEKDDISALQALTSPGYQLAVRNSNEETTYSPNLEPTDLVAGTIPTAYNGLTDYGEVDVNKPLAFDAWPKAFGVTTTTTRQLVVNKVTGVDISELTTSDVTLDNTTYSSDTPGVATVDANGLVSGVAVGSANITATHTYATGKTTTDTVAVTVT